MLSEHYAQLVIIYIYIKKIEPISNYHNYRKRFGLINTDTIKEFTTHVNNENWESDSKFSTIPNIFLKYFQASFPIRTEKNMFENNECLLIDKLHYKRHSLKYFKKTCINLISNNVLAGEQFGDRKNLSTDKAVQFYT